jgi:hypothetical protein
VGNPFSDEPPEIRLGEITFKIREFDSTPPLKILECQIEVLNRSRKSTIPPNSIKLVVTPAGSLSTPAEASLGIPLLPREGQVLTFGFPLPAGDEPINFEVQVNPPEGEKKTVIWKP